MSYLYDLYFIYNTMYFVKLLMFLRIAIPISTASCFGSSVNNCKINKVKVCMNFCVPK